jgi:hypothetical protein
MGRQRKENNQTPNKDGNSSIQVSYVRNGTERVLREPKIAAKTAFVDDYKPLLVATGTLSVHNVRRNINPLFNSVSFSIQAMSYLLALSRL